MGKKKKMPPVIANAKAVREAAKEIENQIAKMCQAMPESLKTIFNRAAALSLVYNGRAQVRILAKNRLKNQTEADVWLTNYLAVPLKAWRPFGVEFDRHYWHGDMFIVILKIK